MRVAISDATGSYFGSANPEGQHRIYEIREEDYRRIRNNYDHRTDIADRVRSLGREVTERRWSGETITV